MTAEVDEDVDLVAAHQRREILVGKRSHLVPVIDQRRDALGDAVMSGAGEVSVDLELRAIVVLENRLYEVADDVVAKLRRDVTEPEPAAGVRDIAERRPRRQKRLLEASREFAVPRVDLSGRETCRTQHQKEQVLKRDHRVPVVKHGELVMPQGVAVARLVAKNAAEQAVRVGGVGIAGQDPLDTARGLVKLVGQEMHFAEDHQGVPVVGLRPQISAQRGLR